MARIKKSDIDAAQPHPTKNVRLWDDDPRGLFLYVKPSGLKAFAVQYTSPATGKRVRMNVGQYGRLTLAEARSEAKSILGQVEKGIDPSREKRLAREKVRSTARTVSDLCDDYMRDTRAGLVTYRGKPKKPSTIKIDDGRVRRHIMPILGSKLVADVTATDITRLFHDIRTGKIAVNEKTGPRGRARVTGGATTAKRTVDLFGSIMSYAARNGLRLDNPVARFERPETRRRDRALSPREYRALEKALDVLEAKGANAVAIRAIRAIALTGCRRGEIFGLRRSEIDAHRQCLRFGDTKSGQQVRAIGRAALVLLTEAPAKEGCPFAFPASRGDGHLVDAKVFQRGCEEAGLEGVTIHTLRHGFASVALELEYSELTIAGLLGHRSSSVTSRYAHHVDRALVAAADRISALIAARMEGREAEGADVVPIDTVHHG